MPNFTEEIKNEIIDNGVERECCKLAFLSAFLRTSGSILSRGGNYGFEIVTENDRTAEFLCDMLENHYGITLETTGLLSSLKLIKRSADGVSIIFGIDDDILEDDGCIAAYLNGAFLGGGSCTLPDEGSYSRTGYHFEVVFYNKVTAGDFCDLLCSVDVLAKSVSRKDSAVVYVKSKEVISDLLNAMGAYRCLQKLNRLVELKDKTNNVNRVGNCSASNIDKTVTASVKQIGAIETIRQVIGLKNLTPMLFEVAEARLADPNASMQELADRLGITKSCLNHRFRKLISLAEQLS